MIKARVAKILEFPDLLRLIDERLIAFRAAVASEPSLDVQVRNCPEWTPFDLVQHLGAGLLGRHHHRRACRHRQVHLGRHPCCAPGA
ncbi:maleylpyruvate isomerase N-terminal domain-containing protein [Micromonospora sp. NPDC050417]|uniref:maleylpyruvate isomerase N-terminal domain-containing protein n=1 Tax=Micromonospora sp. NPDC050417 TaxID=3364280 RepID=UPI0037ADF608